MNLYVEGRKVHYITFESADKRFVQTYATNLPEGKILDLALEGYRRYEWCPEGMVGRRYSDHFEALQRMEADGVDLGSASFGDRFYSSNVNDITVGIVIRIAKYYGLDIWFDPVETERYIFS